MRCMGTPYCAAHSARKSSKLPLAGSCQARHGGVAARPMPIALARMLSLPYSLAISLVSDRQPARTTLEA